MPKTDAEKENEARRTRQTAVAKSNLEYKKTRATLQSSATKLLDKITELDCQHEYDIALINQDA